jgi:catechol 2,3-dioxygenase-like lactoylglutathione lyase family enzyme
MMIGQIDDLLTQYERGAISRRQLLAAVVMLPAAARGVDAQATAAPAFSGRILNHVTVSVSDVNASKAFYMELLGATVQKELPNQADLRIGSSFVTVLGGTRAPGIMHFCVGVDKFAGEEALALLKRRFPQTKPRLVTNELGQQQIILEDRDGVVVELSDPKYRL